MDTYQSPSQGGSAGSNPVGATNKYGPSVAFAAMRGDKKGTGRHALAVHRGSPWICRHSLTAGLIFGIAAFLGFWLAGFSNYPYMLIPGVIAYIALTYADSVWPGA